MKRTPVIVLSGVILAAAVSAALIVSSGRSDGKDGQSADVNVSKINLKPSQEQDEYTVKEDTQVDILLENTAVPVGTSLKVTAIVTPDDNEKSLIWTSSNEQVFSVDKEGVMTVNGTGTATLTATVGSVSDAVVIEGISRVSEGSSNGFVVYTGSSYNAAVNTYGNSGNPGNVENSDYNPDSQVSDYNSGNQEKRESGQEADESGKGGSWQGGSQTGTDSSENSYSGNESSGNSSSENDSSENNSSGNSSSGNSSGDIGGLLSEEGFEQTVSNVYVCRQDGVYYGEIITQSNVTIIYIKQRSAAFDNRIQSVIENLLPGNSAYVWNSYTSASTDRTFTVDNRIVRIVVATGGGHSQIVIYN